MEVAYGDNIPKTYPCKLCKQLGIALQIEPYGLDEDYCEDIRIQDKILAGKEDLFPCDKRMYLSVCEYCFKSHSNRLIRLNKKH